MVCRAVLKIMGALRPYVIVRRVELGGTEMSGSNECLHGFGGLGLGFSSLEGN